MRSLNPEQTKSLELLTFALKKNNVNEHSYHIGVTGDEEKLFEGLCFLEGDDGWIVLYTERGNVSEKTIHNSFDTAIDDFYHRAIEDLGIWAYREEWEKETGKEF